MPFTILESKLVDNRPNKNYIRKGFSIPFNIDENGRIACSTGQELDEQGILIHLMDTSNDNAFMQIDSYESLIFKQNTTDVKNYVTTKLKRIFDMFENQHRMRLNEETILVERIAESVYISFEYYNIEQDQTRKISIKGT